MCGGRRLSLPPRRRPAGIIAVAQGGGRRLSLPSRSAGGVGPEGALSCSICLPKRLFRPTLTPPHPTRPDPPPMADLHTRMQSLLSPFSFALLAPHRCSLSRRRYLSIPLRSATSCTRPRLLAAHQQSVRRNDWGHERLSEMQNWTGGKCKAENGVGAAMWMRHTCCDPCDGS